jgi:hypothetical protein
MNSNPHIITEHTEAVARQDRILDFKDEGENDEGMPIGTLTLRSSGEPVFQDGRWVTKRHARRIAAAWGVELYEF